MSIKRKAVKAIKFVLRGLLNIAGTALFLCSMAFYFLSDFCRECDASDNK